MSALVGDSDSGSGRSSEDEEDQNNAEAETEAKATSSQKFDFWSAASGLADKLKRETADLATTVRTTDWKAEIQAFGEDLVEETEEIGASAVAAAHSAVEGIEHLPQTAQNALPAIEQQRRAVRAQLGEMGSNLGRFGRGLVSNTTDLFEQATAAIHKEVTAASSEGPEGRMARRGVLSTAHGSAPTSARYSRLNSDIAAMQRNSATYCEEPQDAAGYNAWLQSFETRERTADIEGVRQETPFMVELESRIVPVIVDSPTFWRRYFYHLHLLREAHDTRAKVAARATITQAEEAGWDDEEPASPTSAAGMGAAGSSAPVQPTIVGGQDPHKQQGEEGQPTETPTATGSPAAAEGGDTSAQQISEPRETAGTTEDDVIVTASDDSSGGSGPPWTVVSSPTKKTTKAYHSLSPAHKEQPASAPSAKAKPELSEAPSSHAAPPDKSGPTAIPGGEPEASSPAAPTDTSAVQSEERQQRGAAPEASAKSATFVATSGTVAGSRQGSHSGSEDSEWAADVEAAEDSDGNGNSEEDWA